MIYSIPISDRSDEVISICKSLMEGAGEAFREDFLTEGMGNTVYQDRKERMNEHCCNV